MTVGNVIKSYRKKKRISQLEIAKKSGVSQTYLSKIENGSCNATIDIIEKICDSLEIPLPILLFLSFDINEIEKSKRDDFVRIKPLIDNMIQELFILED